jgi:hypothetical protein
MKTWFFGFSAAILLFVVGICYAYPEPSIVGGANEWTLEVVFDQPQQIMVKLPGDKRPSRFWYIILTLTNNSGIGDAPFYPGCDLMTDTFQIVNAGKGIHKVVFEKIRLRHQAKYPFLEPLDSVGANKILEGVDNTRDVAIIWPDFDPKAKNITLFIAGLSNETAAINHPAKTDEDGKPAKVYLRKTLALEYAIGGDESLRACANLAYKGKRWVMR